MSILQIALEFNLNSNLQVVFGYNMPLHRFFSSLIPCHLAVQFLGFGAMF